jgi:hypothetical protein
MRSLIVSLGIVLAGSLAWADTIDPSLNLFSTRPIKDAWHIDWLSIGDQITPVVSVGSLALVSIPPLQQVDAQPLQQGDAQPLQQGDAQPLHAAAIEHSNAYQTRAKIHKYSSFATLPLFAVELALGQSLYNNTPGLHAGGNRTAHAFIGAGIVGLFGLNTVTGAWNLFGEGWSDRQGRTRRLVHGLLMMAADVGFLATEQSGPNSGSPRQALTFETDKVTHRNMAIASISVATASYLLMLLGNH